ncbi:MAG: DNA polymerase III subunit gamma/tau [Prevotellaceae bacterium]|jgi:DNA polymerase-3 subunit gamma/tau|nr:DNA polymerase III subunit gamma/tau [Prevotellaceae bacterium]
MEQFVVSAIKYRPLTFASVVGQSSISTTLKNAIQRQHLAHAYLFCGPRGVGKTTCARIFAKTINCLSPTADMEACGVCESCKSFAEGRSYSIHELDAASNNSVEDIRLLIDKVRVPPQIGKYSVYIIDEVHMLSASAFNAFLKTLEEPPAHAIFILATTEKHKILPTILSRCQIFDFNRITIEDTVKHLGEIADKEGIKYEPEAFNIIAHKADGAMRDALSIYDRVISFCSNDITYKAVIEDLNVLDYEYYFRITDAFLESRYTDAILILDEILRKGFDTLHFISGLSTHFRDLLVCKDPRTVPLLEVSHSIAERYKQQAAQSSVEFLFDALNLSNQCEVGYKNSGNPRLHVELSLIKIANIRLEKKNSLNVSEEKNSGKEAITAQQPVSTVDVPKTKPLPDAPQSISLKNMLNDAAEASDTPKEEVVKTEEPGVSFTEEQLVEKWRQYAQSIQAKQPRLSSALLEHTAKLVDGYIINYPALHEKQKQQLTERTQGLIDFLRKELKNPKIQIEWVVEETILEKAKNAVYTLDDKLKFLIQKNPVVEKLKKDLDLDFR